MTTYEILILSATIISAIAAVAFVWAMMSTYKGQMNAQVFSDYNKRYDEILLSMPKDAWEARFNMNAVLPAPSKELSLSILRYLNLSSEEFYLYKRGYLRVDVWRIWEEEMIRTLQTPLLKREWQTLLIEFVSYREFYEFVEEVQRNKKEK